MPRIYTGASDPLDFCFYCFPTQAKAWEDYGPGEGPERRRGNCFGYDAEHPPYENENYHCEKCGRRLCDIDE